eukprot:6181471-Pleurochrysis_carterae.AAC.5
MLSQDGVPFTPSDVLPVATALRAYSICTSFPEGLNVVSEKLYAESPITRECLQANQIAGDDRHLTYALKRQTPVAMDSPSHAVFSPPASSLTPARSAQRWSQRRARTSVGFCGCLWAPTSTAPRKSKVTKSTFLFVWGYQSPTRHMMQRIGILTTQSCRVSRSQGC